MYQNWAAKVELLIEKLVKFQIVVCKFTGKLPQKK